VELLPAGSIGSSEQGTTGWWYYACSGIIHNIYAILGDYPALPGYLFIAVFYETGKGMNSICSVKLK
jgi:hypothetical protein